MCIVVYHEYTVPVVSMLLPLAMDRDARRAQRRRVDQTMAALVDARVCSQQSVGQLNGSLLAAAISAREQGCSTLAAVKAALQQQGSTIGEWLIACGCSTATSTHLKRMLERLLELQRSSYGDVRYFSSWLCCKDNIQDFSSIVRAQLPEPEAGCWYICFLVQLSMLNRGYQSLALPLLKALKDKEDAQTPLSQEEKLSGKKLCKYFELVPQYFSMHCRNTGEEVNAAMSQLGSARFWTGIGERVAQFHHMHEGRRYVRNLDDALIRQAVCQVNGRTRGQSSTASQSKLRPLVCHVCPHVRDASMYFLRMYLIRYALGWQW